VPAFDDDFKTNDQAGWSDQDEGRCLKW
jgi:hypothetical protein